MVRLTSRQPLALTSQQRVQVSRAAKENELLVKLLGGAGAVKPRLVPGTAAFSGAARSDYQALVQHAGGARLPAAFRVRTVPAEVKRAVDAFSAELRQAGAVDVAVNTIDGHVSYQVQLATSAVTHVLLLSARGQELARGHVRGAQVSWQR